MLLDGSPASYALVTGIATAAVLFFDAAQWPVGRAIAKTTAASGFVLIAWVGGAPETPSGRWILGGLLLSWVGDVALLARARPNLFRLGFASFLLGHLAYAAAFAVRGLAAGTAGLAALIALAPAVLVLGWLDPHLPASMRAPVRAYVAVISLMVVLAAATVARNGDASIFAGAFSFYLSDLAVARERFVTRSFFNGVWGSPLYFGGQVLLALSTAVR